MNGFYTTSADTQKHFLHVAIDAAIAQYRKDYINGKKGTLTRKRKLPLKTMVKLLLSMQGGSLQKELCDASIEVSASAFVQQRSHISWDLFENVLKEYNELNRENKTYKGYRIFAVDGTTVNMARNPKSDSFVHYEGNPKGYNQLHVNPLYDVLNKTYQYCEIQPQPKQDEVGALANMLEWYDFPKKSLIVADRGYESYNTFAIFQNKPNVDFLICIKQDRTAMKAIQKLPKTELDTYVEFTLTTTQTNEDKKNGYIYIQTRKKEDKTYSMKTGLRRWDFGSPYKMRFRVVRILLDTGEYETLATSLPQSITAEEIKELYHARWGIETAFRELKYGLGLVNLHGKKDEFVKQEIFAAMIMANFCSYIANDIVIHRKPNNAYAYAVNMKMAVYLCRQFFRHEDADGKKLLNDIAKYTEPVRAGRKDERNIKAKSFIGFTYRVSA